VVPWFERIIPKITLGVVLGIFCGKNMKIAGIIGGFGPEATIRLQLEIVEAFRGLNIKNRPPLLIWQTPVPTKTEKLLIIKAKGLQKFLPFLIDAAQRLENGGADFLVLPCNTMHLLINDLQMSTSLPIVNLIEEIATILSQDGIKRIGIIAAQRTIENGLHQRCLLAKGIKPILPSGGQQNLINNAISQILSNENLDRAKIGLLKVTKNLQAKGIKDILLACTDLKPFFPEVTNVKVHDTLQILANVTVRKILEVRRI
jgi:aspartate racemase